MEKKAAVYAAHKSFCRWIMISEAWILSLNAHLEAHLKNDLSSFNERVNIMNEKRNV